MCKVVVNSGTFKVFVMFVERKTHKRTKKYSQLPQYTETQHLTHKQTSTQGQHTTHRIQHPYQQLLEHRSLIGLGEVQNIGISGRGVRAVENTQVLSEGAVAL